MTPISFRATSSVLLAALGLLAACGGGGDGGSPAAPPDTLAPTISSVSPAASSAGNGAGPVDVVFSEPVKCSSLVADSLTVSDGATVIPGLTTCSGNALSFVPATALPTAATLTGTVRTSVTDLAGNALGAPMNWQFKTAAWTQQLGTDRIDAGQAVAIDALGNIYVAGATEGSVDGQASAGSFDVLLVKFDRFGVKQWSRQFGTPASDSAYALAIDAAGNVFVGGGTDGDLDANAGNNATDGFIAKFDGAGTRLWTRQLHSSQPDLVRALAVDPAGNVIATGYTLGALFGGGIRGPDIMVAKYDSAGTLLWGRQLGTTSADVAGGVVTDAAGNVYLGGYTGGDLATGGSATTGPDVVLIKLDSAGATQWVRQIAEASSDFGSALAIDAGGHLYLAGRTDGTLGGTNAGDLDALLMKFDSSDGSLLWARQVGSPAADHAFGVATDVSGNVAITGYTLGGLDGLASAGNYDGFVVKYDSAGTKLWSRQFGSAAVDQAYGLAFDADGNVFIAGTTGGSLDGRPNAGADDLMLVKYGPDGSAR